MEIYNTTTEKTENLAIYDRQTGIEWTSDLIGNHGDLHYSQADDRYEGDQEYIDWWQNIIDGLNKIDELTDQTKEILNPDDFEDLERKLEDEGNTNDLESHVSILTRILNEVINNERNK